MKKSQLVRKTPLRAKIKICKGCQKPRKLWSAGYCIQCAKNKDRKYVKGEPVTVGMVDQVFSWLVRTVYPNYCHGCKVAFPYRLLQCSHLVGRGASLVRWDLRNAYPADEDCNYNDRNHQILLSAECDRYHGPGTAEKLAAYRHDRYQWAQFELEELYIIFSEALTEAEKPEADKKKIRQQVIEKTKRVL